MIQWARERWRKLFLREPVQHQATWPLMQRGMRDYCVRVSEDDGTLATLRGDADPVEFLLLVLGAKDPERELARQAIESLFEEGFLLKDEHHIFIANSEIYDPDFVAAKPPQSSHAPLSAAERARRYRARRAANGFAELRWSKANYKFVKERDGDRCRYCGSGADLTIDHIIPRCQGGGDEAENLAVACRSCNCRKRGRTPEQAGMVLH